MTSMIRIFDYLRSIRNYWSAPFVLVLLSVLHGYGQHDAFVFAEVEGILGRPLNKVRSVTQDTNGYMWFAAEGEKCLFRYDGKHLTIFRQDFTENNSIGSVEISAVHADKDGMIWIGFGDGGIDRYDPSINVFTHFEHDESNKGSVNNGSVMALLTDRNGTLWIGTSHGLDQFNKVSGSFTHYNHEPDNPRSLSCNFVSTLYEDRDGVLWVGTAGLHWEIPAPSEGGLNRMDEDGGFVRYMHDPNDDHSLISNKVNAILEDSRGVFWVGTAGDGLHTLDRATGKFERHTWDPAHPEKLSRTPHEDTPWFNATDVITFIVEDHSGVIWFGTLWAGICRYDPATRTITRYNRSNGYDDNTSWNAFVSREGLLWLSSNKPALYRVDAARKVFGSVTVRPRNSTANIIRMLENEDGTLWACSGEGLLLLDSAGELLERLPLSKDPDKPLIVSALLRGDGDILWLGNAHGLYKLNTKTKQYTKLDLGFESHLVIHIVKDDDGGIWFTDLDFGVARYDDKTGTAIRYQHVSNDPTSLIGNHVIDVHADGNYVWVATTAGISRFNRQTGKFQQILTGGKGTFLYRDHSGTLWAGTTNGVHRYNAERNIFVPAGGNSAISTERTFGIAEDNHNNLWVVGPSNIVRIDSTRTITSQFGAHNGIAPGSIVPGSIYMTRKGNLLIGHEDGYYNINADALNFKEEPPHVLITGFLVNNTPVSQTLGHVDVPVESISHVALDHDQNNLEITFTMPDYRDPGGNRFFTMLEGYDNVWRDESSDQSSLYLSIPHGDYIFHLRAYTSGGAMAERQVAISLSPPWWLTNWAYVAYIALAAMVLFGARRLIVHDERLRANLQLEHVELEKAKEVDRVKTSFFANISHEFRTPLTLIDAPVQALLEKHANDPGTKEKLKLIQRNAGLLLKLINQLLDLAKVEAGNLKREESEGDLYAWLRMVTSSFESLATQKGVSLSIEIPVVMRPALYDNSKVETILINLVSNAIKFTPSGGVVHVRASANNGELLLVVRDSGIGIAVEEQERIFDRFHQVSEEHSEVGTGIGLALVKEVIAFLGGTIAVKSELGKGSEFRATLPVTLLESIGNKAVTQDATQRVSAQNGTVTSHMTHSVQQTEDVDRNTAVTDHNTAHADRNGAHDDHVPDRYSILVVEDNTDLRAFIIDALGPDYLFLEAKHGVEGIASATAEIPNVIISDVMMPEMDGMAMVKKIKKDIRTSHIPVLFLTAKASEQSKLQGLETGADDYLVKPFNKHELILEVRNTIARQDKLREKLRAELLGHAPAVAVLSDDEKFLDRVKKIILERMADDQLGVESLSTEVGLSRSHLFRKITALTGMSVVELIRKLRLQRAAQLISQSWGPVAQVAYEVGFSNPSYFSKCFKEEFGVLPSAYETKSNVMKS